MKLIHPFYGRAVCCDCAAKKPYVIKGKTIDHASFKTNTCDLCSFAKQQAIFKRDSNVLCTDGPLADLARAVVEGVNSAFTDATIFISDDVTGFPSIKSFVNIEHVCNNHLFSFCSLYFCYIIW
jgi:hypothetical protein